VLEARRSTPRDQAHRRRGRRRPCRDQHQKATRIGLIVNELVTNALKHAFPDDGAGTVWVKLRRTPTELTLVVEDDGVGCPEEAKDGLGSRLTRLLVQQLGGTMTREPHNDHDSVSRRMTISGLSLSGGSS
jgi:two-component sensor histidine kinase